MVGKRVKLILLSAFLALLLAVTYLVFVLLFKDKFPTLGGQQNIYLSFDSPQSTMSNRTDGSLRVFFDYRKLQINSNDYLKNGKRVASFGVVSSVDSRGFKLNADSDYYLLNKGVPIYLIDSKYVDLRYIEKVKVIDANFLKVGTRVIYNLGVHPDYQASILVYPQEESK